MFKNNNNPLQSSKQEEIDTTNQREYTHLTPNIPIEDEINHHEAALKHLHRTQGQHYDPIGHLCRQVGIKKRYLAFGLIMQAKGELTAAELARRLGVSKSTISRWPDVARALKAI